MRFQRLWGFDGGSISNRDRSFPAPNVSGDRTAAGQLVQRENPVNRWIQFLLFAVGVLLFGRLLSGIGLPQLREDALASGWMMIPIILLFGVVYFCDTQALRLILADEPVRPGFLALYATVVSGNALNFITPMLNVGGEPYKVATLAPVIGATRAAGAVVLHTMIRTLALLLIWVTAILLGLVFLPHTVPVIGLLVLGLGATGGLILLLLAAHRRGGAARLVGWVGRVPLLRRLAPALEARRPALEAMDAQITDFYHRQPARFRAALGWEFLARAVFMAEFCLIGLAVGVSVGYHEAFLVGGLEGLISNVFFFVPFELGTRESATVLVFQQLGFESDIGLFAALVGRVRDLAWIAVGLALIWVRARRPLTASRPIEESAR